MMSMCPLTHNKYFVVFCVIWLFLDVHVLRWKTWGRKGLIFYKTKNGTSAMKKHCEVEHSSILKMYVHDIV
jgi:hypothetical protein